MDPVWRGMGQVEMAIRSIAESAFTWYFLFAAWAALYIALSTQRQLRSPIAGRARWRAKRRKRSCGRCATRSTRISCSAP